jgi:hypothetical protein
MSTTGPDIFALLALISATSIALALVFTGEAQTLKELLQIGVAVMGGVGLAAAINYFS